MKDLSVIEKHFDLDILEEQKELLDRIIIELIYKSSKIYDDEEVEDLTEDQIRRLDQLDHDREVFCGLLGLIEDLIYEAKRMK